MSKKRLKALFGSIALVALALGIPLQAAAQDGDRTFMQVRTIHVKPGRTQQHVALVKQFAKASAAAGNSRTVWQEVRGDTNTFHVVTPLDGLAANDAPFAAPMESEEMQNWLAAFADNIDTMTYSVYRTHPELGIPADEGSTPNLLVLRMITLEPGNMGPYHDWINDQLVPALKKGGATGVNISHLAYGGDVNTWVLASRADSWADLGVRRGSLAYLSDEDYAALMAPNAGKVWGNNVKVLSYRADLSN
jgi:hypothetical protein